MEGDVVAQTERVLENIRAVLETAGSSLDLVLKTTVFLKNMGDFPRMNEVYARYFGANSPEDQRLRQHGSRAMCRSRSNASPPSAN